MAVFFKICLLISFRDFIPSGLYAIAFEFGGLTYIEQHAFRGLEGSLKELYFKNNQLTEVHSIIYKQF